MTPEYYEGVVLSAIWELQQTGQRCGQTAVTELTGLGNTTYIKARRRLEAKGRLCVHRNPGPRLSRYEILDPPNQFDLDALSLHLESRGNHK